MKAIAVVSGGMDSTGYMAHKRKDFQIEAITFNYGQKAKKETEILREICNELDIPLKVIDLSFMKSLWKGNQLTDLEVKVKEHYEPSVVVPLRNGVFLMIAISYAYSINAEVVLFGSHQGDIAPFRHDGHYEPYYPDCHPDFASDLEEACITGTFKCDPPVKLLSPAIERMKKKDVLFYGHQAIGDLIFKTWSCYESGKTHCGKCESCINRKKAVLEVGLKDRTEYANV